MKKTCKLTMEGTQSSPLNGANSRNWLELPRDVTISIFMKLKPNEILESTQFVCKLWYNLCKDPSMWRTIELKQSEDDIYGGKYNKMLECAIDRSDGGLIKLDIEGFGPRYVFTYFSQRSNQLKQFRLVSCDSVSSDVLIEAFSRFPLLEELEITVCLFSAEQILSIIRCCPNLKIFKLNKFGSQDPYVECDDEALAIATNMRELQQLQLIANTLTNDGLVAILDNCPHLQSLDLRACYHVDLVGSLEKRCRERIKNLRHPYDSTDDYNYLTTNDDSDIDYHPYLCDPSDSSDDGGYIDYLIDYYTL